MRGTVVQGESELPAARTNSPAAALSRSAGGALELSRGSPSRHVAVVEEPVQELSVVPRPAGRSSPAGRARTRTAATAPCSPPARTRRRRRAVRQRSGLPSRSQIVDHLVREGIAELVRMDVRLGGRKPRKSVSIRSISRWRGTTWSACRVPSGQQRLLLLAALDSPSASSGFSISPADARRPEHLCDVRRECRRAVGQG